MHQMKTSEKIFIFPPTLGCLLAKVVFSFIVYRLSYIHYITEVRLFQYILIRSQVQVQKVGEKVQW